MHLALFIAAGIVALAAIAVVVLLRGPDRARAETPAPVATSATVQSDEPQARFAA